MKSWDLPWRPSFFPWHHQALAPETTCCQSPAIPTSHALQLKGMARAALGLLPMLSPEISWRQPAGAKLWPQTSCTLQVCVTSLPSSLGFYGHWSPPPATIPSPVALVDEPGRHAVSWDPPACGSAKPSGSSNVQTEHWRIQG
jgi:hypothetical protein